MTDPMKNEREERARAHLDAYGWQSTLEQGAAFVRMMLAFADDELERAATAAEDREPTGIMTAFTEAQCMSHGEDIATTIRAMKGDGK